MIDPLRFVSADGGIDYFSFVVESEIVSARFVEVLRDVRPQNAASGVFNDEFPFSDRLGGENAATVDPRFLNN